MTTAATAIGYARISKDDRREGRGVARQREDIARVSERHGWTLVEVLTENDVSASRYGKKPRAKYARLLERVRAGEVDRVVVYDADRLLRQPRELEDLIDLVEQMPGVEVHTINGLVDLTTSSGRFTARTLVAKSAMESDDLSRRLRRANDQKAADGRPHGARAFGYSCKGRHRPEDCKHPVCPCHRFDCPEECDTRACTRHCTLPDCPHDGVTVIEHEAELLRQAARDVVGGASLASIARRWNQAGILTPQRNKRWSTTVVKAVLTGERQAGLRVHRGTVTGKGDWAPIIDRATHARLRGLLLDPARGRRVPGKRQAFTGILRSAATGSAMTRNTVRGRQVYKTIHQPGREGGRVSIAAEPVEKLVLEIMFSDATSGGVAARVAARRAAAAREAAVEAEDPDALQRELDALATDYGDGRFGRSEWLAAREPLERRLRIAVATRRSVDDHPAAEVLVAAGDDLVGYWAQLETEGNVDRQRAVLGAIFDRVNIHPTERRGCVFDTGRVEPIWRE